ncbi:MAG: hypothetical protein B1H12_09500 [Desulfobacteraceae bacterium 4484_190.2]|nr:MAG: hypothetical protein B1H12_09500 [Desulfobacteraceae bacterium 4484_190.2]
MRKIDKYKPAVTKNFLLFFAGLVWVFVGIMLLFLAFSWLSTASNLNTYLPASAGVILALIVHHFGFLKIADKNLKRILLMNEKKCLFAFIPWKSYIIIAVMIMMGAVLRHSSIPKQYLAILYIGIGLALILSSVRYMRMFIREIRRKNLAY